MVTISSRNFQMRKLRPKVQIHPRLVSLEPCALFPFTDPCIRPVSWENNVIRNWHLMEALDHVPLEAAALSVLCSVYLNDLCSHHGCPVGMV